MPKAHALSPRSLEICRQLHVPVHVLRSLPAHREDAQYVQFVTNLSGQHLGRLDYERMHADVLNHSAEMTHNVSQPDLEEILETLLLQDPACAHRVDYRKGWTWTGYAERVDAHGATYCVSRLEDTYTGEEATVSSLLIVGADGANSAVRERTGIASEGEQTADVMMTIHFHADLRPVVGANVGMLHWILDPEARGFLIAYDLDCNHVLIHNVAPDDALASYTPDKCMRIVRAAIGADVPFDFQCSMPWILTRKVAKQYYRGNVVLAGDAAHQYPPTGGLGMNSGIGDAHNLVYKLAATYHGWADLPAMFASYEAERRPVAVRNSVQSVKNGKSMFALLKALGTTSGDPSIARAEMERALADPRQLAYIRELISDQAEHFDNLNLHLGYVYYSGYEPRSASAYHPAYVRGARLPHAWVRAKSGSRGAGGTSGGGTGGSGGVFNGLKPVDLRYVARELGPDKLAKWHYSTLDLVPPASYVLVHGGGWAKKAAELRMLLGAHGVPLAVLEAGRDFDFVDKKAGKAWVEGFGLKSGGAVLVRPDQHVEAVAARDTVPQAIVDQVLVTLTI